MCVKPGVRWKSSPGFRKHPYQLSQKGKWRNSLSHVPEVFWLKLMALNAHNDGLMSVNGFPINLRRKWKNEQSVIVVFLVSKLYKDAFGVYDALTYGADSVGIVILDVDSDGRVHGTSPAFDGAVNVMGSGVTGLLPQVIKLEGDLVLGVQDPAVSKVTMLCD